MSTQPPERPRAIFRYRLADGRVRRETDASLEPTSILWTGDNGILTLARATEGSSPQRADWWLLTSDEEPRNLSADLDAVPTSLFPEEGGGRSPAWATKASCGCR